MTCRAATSATACAGAQIGAQLAYDNEGRLSAWQNAPTSPTASASYLYDGAGNRVQQVATSSGTTTITSYLGNLEEVTSSGGTTTTTAYYGSIAESVNGTLSYLLSDGLGSVSEALSASTGAVTATQLYGPYGAVRSQSGSLPTSKGYTGQRSDAASSGLDYYGARYYDPVAGQFTSADTTLAGGLNRYAYVAGNPETRTDPSGHAYAPGNSGSGGDTWVTPNNKDYPNTYDDFVHHVGYPGRYWIMPTRDKKKYSEEYSDGDKLFEYFGANVTDQNGHLQHEGPSLWKIDATWAEKQKIGTTADYIVGYETPLLSICGYDPCIATTLTPLIPIDLYKPLKDTPTKNIMSYAVTKGSKQAAIIAIDVTNNTDLHGNTAAQQALAYRMINYQPSAKAHTSVMRVIFIDGDTISDVNPFNYGPPPGGGIIA